MLNLKRLSLSKRGMVVAFFVLLALLVLLSAHVRSASAQTQAPMAHYFTSTPTADGVVIVDQSTGFITFCTSFVQKKQNLAGALTPSPAGQCASIGRITASPAAVPNLVPNLIVIPQPPSLYVVNNVTGQIVQCSTTSTIVASGSIATGSCITQGLAAQ